MKLRPNRLGIVDIKQKETYMANPFPKGFVKVNIPEGKSGDWQVSKFTVTDDSIGLYNLRLIRNGYPERVVPPGEYTRLTRSGTVVMSDTPAEAHEHYKAFRVAKGSVLLNGLGLGFFLTALLGKADVNHVTVIEKSPDVIKLVTPTFNGRQVRIINADALEWRPDKGTNYDFVWHDIWDSICDDNKTQMQKLKRAYAKRCDAQSCWSQNYL